jgi:Na+-translocating ferredoxin:NAD+ oxidoreductase subunit D
MVYQGVVLGPRYALAIFVIMLVSHVTTLLADILVALLRYQPTIGHLMTHIIKVINGNYSYVTATLFALIIPVGTPMYAVITGALFSTLLVKYAFGGFGANIFNPAIFGRLFVGIAFAADLKTFLPGDNFLMVPTLNDVGATITSALNSQGWLVDSMQGFNVSLNDLLLGFYSGSIGETPTLLILGLGTVLTFMNVHNWRPTVFFYTTIFLTTLVMGSLGGVDPWVFSIIFMSSGSIAFGGSFMLTDPVTSPTSNFGKSLIGVIAGFLVVLIRFQTPSPEAVAYSIALVNIVSPTIDKLATGLINQNLLGKWGMIGATAFASFGINGSLVIASLNSTSSSESSVSSSTHGSSSEPVTYFKTLIGNATSGNCLDTDDNCTDAEYHEDTISVNVHVDEFYRIQAIDVSGTVTTSGPWRTQWNNQIVSLLESYQALSIQGIQGLNTLALPTDLNIVSVTSSSIRLANALKDAVKDVEVNEGSFASVIPDHPEFGEYLMNVIVYVEEGSISAIDLEPEGVVSDHEDYIDLWDAGYVSLLEAYRGYDVQEFLALTDIPTDFNTTGVTASSSRLFNAIQNALAGYGA